MDCLLSLDIGSSAAKVGLIDERGHLLAMSSHPYPTQEPRPRHKEQNPADWWAAAREGIRRCVSLAPSGSIRAIGCVGHISSCTFLDQRQQVLRPSISFQDQRAHEEFAALQRIFARAELAKLLGIDLPPAPTWPLPKLLWMKKHEPEILGRTKYLLQAKDYINLRLTGVCASDPSSNRGLVDLARNQPAHRVFQRLGLPDLLPPLFAPESLIGGVSAPAALETGLAQGCPVVAGWNDLNACALGSGVVEAGQSFNVTGTSEHIGVVIDGECGSDQLICAPYFAGRRLLYGVTSCGGGSLQWFSEFSGRPIADLLAETPRCDSELLFLPYLEGERSPIWDPLASATLLGLRSGHGQGDAARAILKGVAYSLRQSLDLLQAQGVVGPQPLIVSGGASTISLWNQIKADVFGKPVATLGNPHAGVQGAAILAAVAVGIHPDLEAAALAMTRPDALFRPSAKAKAHADRMFSLYTRAYPAIRDIMAELSAETPHPHGGSFDE